MSESYKIKEEYKEGYTMGMVEGEKDANMLVNPYPYTEGEEIYQLGYTNGYFMRYTQGLSALLKQNPSVEMIEMIALHLEQISECMKIENNKTNESTK